jgi:hypothetical protein
MHFTASTPIGRTAIARGGAGRLTIVAALVGLCALAPAVSLQSAGGPAITTLAVPGRANAHVSLVAEGAFVGAVWSASTADGPTDIYVAASRDGGGTFGAPVRVNSSPGDARVNGEQPPRLTLAARAGRVPQMTVIWTSKRSAGTALLTARSDDGGKTFSPSTLITGTDVAGNRGWEAIGADRQGGVHAVWLDHRRMAAPDASKTAAAHQHGAHAESGGKAGPMAKADGVAMAQQSDLYFDTLGDDSAPRALTPGVCYCCKTAIAFGAGGEIYLAWRHVYPGNFRDMAFTLSRDGGRTFAAPVRVSQDNWMLEGCPDDGPTMKVDLRGRIHMVWPAVITERDTQIKALFHAVSTDGQVFSPRTRLPTQGQANHPQLAVSADASLTVTWDESGSGSRQIVYGRAAVDNSGRASFTRIPLNGTPGVYPMIAALPSGAMIAWTSGAPAASVISLRRVR